MAPRVLFPLYILFITNKVDFTIVWLLVEFLQASIVEDEHFTVRRTNANNKIIN